MGCALPGPDSSIQRDNLTIQHDLQRGRHTAFPFFGPSGVISSIMVPASERLHTENSIEVSNPLEAWYSGAPYGLGKGERLWVRGKGKRT